MIAVNKIDRADQATDGRRAARGRRSSRSPRRSSRSRRAPAPAYRALVDILVSLLPAGSVLLRVAEQLSDQSERVWLAELVREQVLARTREEVPHAVEVEVEGDRRARDDLVRIEAVILAETESQKRILIGAGGQMVKSIGIAARRAIERELGERVHLALSVRVRRHWRADEALLDRLGIE